MLNHRERIEAFWAGEAVHPIPFTIYQNEWRHTQSDPAWLPLFEKGLAVTWGMPTYRWILDGIQYIDTENKVDGVLYQRKAYVTPLGEVSAEWVDEWPTKYWLECEQDYQTMRYAVEHMRIEPNYQAYLDFAASQPEYVIVHPDVGPSPMQKIIVDLAGLEQFVYHLADYNDAVMGLFEAYRTQFKRICEITADGPGMYISCPESYSTETMGPARFKKWLLSVYEECFPMIRATGKIVGTHFDGKTAACKELIRTMPVDVIESLTPPPEGDQTLAEARAAWPEQLFWTNINVSSYFLPAAELAETVRSLAAQGAPDGRRLAFEISEQYPSNWKESLTTVLEALADR